MSSSSSLSSSPLNEQRAVANKRERKRTQNLNQAYKQLQSIIPKEPSDKMSKIHTLHLALAYIDFLNDILKDSESSSSSNNNNNESVKKVANVISQQKSREQYSNHQGSPSYISNSPGCSSCHLNLSNLASDEEDKYSQPMTNPLRLDCVGQVANGNSISPSFINSTTQNYNSFAPQQQSPNTFYLNNSNLVTTQQSTFCDTTYQHNNNSPTTTSTTIRTDDLTISLRDAFRQYRTTKRKRQHGWAKRSNKLKV